MARHVEPIDVSDFENDEGLCTDQQVLIVVKNFERLEIIQRVESRRRGKRVQPSQPRDGAIACISLKGSAIDDSMLTGGMLASCRSPYEYTRSVDGSAYYNSYDTIYKVSSAGTVDHSNVLMRRLHSVDVSDDQDLVLVASSGFDTLHFFDRDLRPKGMVSLWEVYSKIARSDGNTLFLKGYGLSNSVDSVLNPPREIDPIDVPNGLGVQQSPFYVSGASIASHERILFTGYNASSVYVLSRGTVFEVELGLRSPHCFREIAMPDAQSFFMVVDSGHGRVLYLYHDLTIFKELSFKGLDRPNGSIDGVEWLQFANYSNSGDLLFIADQTRSCIHVVDVPGKRRRSIRYPETWSLHGIYPEAPIV